MKSNRKKIFLLSACALVALGLSLPHPSLALSGNRISNTPVKVYTRQGNHWFLAMKKRTDEKGILKVEDVLPGKYKMKVSNSDTKTGQALAINLKMLDAQGRKIRKKMTVSLYQYVSDTQYFIGTVQTDNDGWIKVSGLSLDTEYLIDLDSGSFIHKKYGELRIKTKAKIDRSDWFQSSYKRTEKNTLEVINVLPGKYKFRAVNRPADQTFTLHACLLDKNGQKARHAKVNLYGYIGGVKTLLGKVKTDKNAWIKVPGVSTGITYRIKVI